MFKRGCGDYTIILEISTKTVRDHWPVTTGSPMSQVLYLLNYILYEL